MGGTNGHATETSECTTIWAGSGGTVGDTDRDGDWYDNCGSAAAAPSGGE